LSQDADSQAPAKKTKADGKIKNLYKGIFCLASETYIRRTHAYSAEQAKMLMISRIAKEKKLINGGGLFKVFDGHLQNFIVELEKK